MSFRTQNRVRAERAQMIADIFYGDAARGDHSAFVDALKDIKHACKQIGLPFDQMLISADALFEGEISDAALAWSEDTGPKFTALDIAKNIAKLEGEGLTHSGLQDVVDDAWTHTDELCADAREVSAEEEYNFDDLSPEVQRQVRINSGGKSNDDLFCYTYDREGCVI